MAWPMISILSLLVFTGVVIGEEDLIASCRWTKWINRDSPGKSGEFEALATHIKKKNVVLGVDEQTVGAECRRVKDQVAWNDIEPMDVFKVPCTGWGGLICKSLDQPGGKDCQNYEVRYMVCPNNVNECALGTANCNEHAYCMKVFDEFTCTCYPGYAGNGVDCSPADECEWSPWLDRDTPGSSGEYEELYQILRDGYWHYDESVPISAFECRDANDKTALELVTPADNFKIPCSAKGLKCKSEEQDGGRECHDYEVRYQVCPPEQRITFKEPCVCYLRGDPAARPFDGDWRLVVEAGTYQMLAISKPCELLVTATLTGKENPANRMFVTSVTVLYGRDTNIELLDNANAKVNGGAVTFPYSGEGYTISIDGKWTVLDIAGCDVVVKFHGKDLSSVMELTASADNAPYTNDAMCGDCNGDVEGYTDINDAAIDVDDKDKYKKAAAVFKTPDISNEENFMK